MKIVIYTYPGMTMMDAIGPYELLRNMPNAEIIFVAKKKGNIMADSGMVQLRIEHKISEIKEADMLIIPGSTIAFIKEMKDKKTLNWIKSINETTQVTASVCTGSIILAATGLLENRKATSHWKPINYLAEYGAEPTHERVVHDGKFVTGAGVSAGIDMALYLAEKFWNEEDAKVAQLAIEYDPKPSLRSGNAQIADRVIIDRASELLEKDAKGDLKFFDKIRNYNTLRKLNK